MGKTRKEYRLSEAAIGTIRAVMQEREMSSETAAIEHIIGSYGERIQLAREIVEVFNETNGPWMERVKWAAQTAEQNSQDLFVAVNTILESKGYQYYIDPDVLLNPVLEDAAKKRKENVARYKQLSDEKKRKGE